MVPRNRNQREYGGGRCVRLEDIDTGHNGTGNQRPIIAGPITRGTGVRSQNHYQSNKPFHHIRIAGNRQIQS